MGGEAINFQARPVATSSWISTPVEINVLQQKNCAVSGSRAKVGTKKRVPPLVADTDGRKHRAAEAKVTHSVRRNAFVAPEITGHISMESTGGTPSWLSAAFTPANPQNVEYQSHMWIGEEMFVPRMAGGSSPPDTKAVTRTPPSKSVYLPPLSGKSAAKVAPCQVHAPKWAQNRECHHKSSRCESYALELGP